MTSIEAEWYPVTSEIGDVAAHLQIVEERIGWYTDRGGIIPAGLKNAKMLLDERYDAALQRAKHIG